jgi:hypothetical protein
MRRETAYCVIITDDRDGEYTKELYLLERQYLDFSNTIRNFDSDSTKFIEITYYTKARTFFDAQDDEFEVTELWPEPCTINLNIDKIYSYSMYEILRFQWRDCQ